MPFYLALHVVFGELAAFCFFAIAILLTQKAIEEKILKRLICLAKGGVGFLITSWIVGGYYYLIHYGPVVKPAIKNGPLPSAHIIFMELKEHVFLFLPFLAIYLYFLLKNNPLELNSNPLFKRSTMFLSGFLFLIIMSMAGMGYIITTGYRLSLQNGLTL